MPSRIFFDPPNFDHYYKMLRSLYSGQAEKAIAASKAHHCAPLVDLGSLSHLTGISPKLLFSITQNKERQYRHFAISRPGREPRIIHAPRTYLKVIQWWILDNILRTQPLPDCVTGFRLGLGPISNAQIHRGSQHVLNLDLLNFFPSIGQDRVLSLWLSLEYNTDVSRQLTELCTFEGALPQGAPTSPAISNLIAKNLDDVLIDFARKAGYKYSRYADDITFSAESRISPSVASHVTVKIEQSGFKINERKTRFLGQGDRIEVTGFTINEKTQLSRRWRNRVRAIFYQATLSPDSYVARLDEIIGYLGVIRDYESKNGSFPPGSKLLHLGMLARQAVSEARVIQEVRLSELLGD